MLHDPVAWNLEDRIRDREQSNRQRITVRGQTSNLQHVVAGLGIQHSGVANVACKGSVTTFVCMCDIVELHRTSIEEVEKVHPTT